MNKKIAVSILAGIMAVAMLLGLIASIIPPASAATSSELKQELNDLKADREKIQDEILHTHTELRNSLAQATPDQYPALMERFSLRYREISQLLMKVQTERVNLPMALVEESRQYYLNTTDSPTRELEARIYAAATTSTMVALLDEKEDHPLDKVFDATLSVAMRMVGLPDDADVRNLILAKRAQINK